MPIPMMGSTDHWMFNNRRFARKKKISLRPRKCYLSNKSLWFKECVVIYCMVTGPGDPVYESFWCDPKELFLYEIKNG